MKLARATSLLSLVAGDEPVWPVTSDADERAMVELARLFGHEPSRAIDPKTGTIAATRSGSVVAYGREVESSAKLYAHLTRRAPAIAIEDPRALPDDVAVVVVPAERFDQPLVEHLYRDHRPRDPGLLVASTPEALHRQVLIRAGALALVRPEPAELVFVAPTVSQNVIRKGSVTYVGGAAPLEELRAQLKKGAHVLGVHTHSDGIDAFLAPELTMCSMIDPLRGPTGGRPSCEIHRYCHRHDLPLEQALASARLLRPEELRARVLLFAVCWGAVLQPSLYDVRRTLQERLLASAGVGAMIAGPGIISYTSNEMLELSLALTQRPLGEALSSFVRRGIRDPLYLFGDPELTFGVERGVQAEERNEAPSISIALGETGTSTEFLRAFAREAGKAGGEEERPGVVERARALLDAIDVPKEDGGEEVRRLLLDLNVELGPVPAHTWLRLPNVTALARSRERCPACESSGWVTEFAIPSAGGCRRRSLTCHRCGNVADEGATARRLRLVSKRECFELIGELPKSAWDARLMVWPHRKTERWSCPWPVAPDGSPVRRLVPPRPLLEGPLQVALVFAEHADFSTLGGFLAEQRNR